VETTFCLINDNVHLHDLGISLVMWQAYHYQTITCFSSEPTFKKFSLSRSLYMHTERGACEQRYSLQYELE
jgi:hypothetical protein